MSKSGVQRAVLLEMIREGVARGLLTVAAGPLASDTEALADALWELHYRRHCPLCGRLHVSPSGHRACESCRSLMKGLAGKKPAGHRTLATGGADDGTPVPRALMPHIRTEGPGSTPARYHPWRAPLHVARVLI